MPLAAGTRLGPYEVLGLIGAGGMGEVYRARDTRLDRSVAIKVLPDELAQDADRRSRFEREARSIAALNHPHICALYDVGDHLGVPYLVMEHVSGETLADRLRAGPLPVRDALEIGAQVAEALHVAHEHGIVHRDLKPGNVMLTDGGAPRQSTPQVKLLDFGLAKLRARDPVGEAATQPARATPREPITARGMVVGTMPYMAPEQLEGREADARSDLWALGAIVYEMVTGRRAFEGASEASLIANIMNAEPPPLSARQPLAPPALDRLVRRCLAKLPGDRWHSAHDLADELRWISQGGSDAGAARAAAWPAGGRRRGMSRSTIALAVGALLLGAGALGWLWLRTPQAAPSPAERRLAVLASSDASVEDPALSPDGKMIALVAEENGQADLFVSRVAGGARVRLTNDTAREHSPAFSPDGERVAFVGWDEAGDTPNVLVVPSFGGDAVVAARGAGAPAWSPDGRHLAVVSVPRERSQELAIVRADGTAAQVVLRADAGYPFLRGAGWSPDGRQLVVERSSGGMAGEIWVVPAAGGAASRVSQDPPGVFSRGPRFAPDGKGIIHSSNRGGSTNLWLLPLDGTPASRLTSGPGPDLSPSVALDGTIAFLNERWRSMLVLFDLETGASRTLLTHASPLWAPAFSPDGKELAYSRAEADGQWHIWAVSLDKGMPRQLTSGPIPEVYPRFTPDGRAVVYCSWTPSANRLWLVPRTGGPPRPVFEQAAGDEQYADVSPDGRRVAFVRTENETSHIYVASLDGRGPPKQLVASQATLPKWSPDGRWIAFARDRGPESGILLAGADGGQARQLTATGGWPVWWPNRRQLGFVVSGADGRQQIWIAPLDGGKAFRLDSVRYRRSNCPFDVSADGRWLATTDGERIVSEIWLLKPAR